jgi:hypothetical protein
MEEGRCLEKGKVAAHAHTWGGRLALPRDPRVLVWLFLQIQGVTVLKLAACLQAQLTGKAKNILSTSTCYTRPVAVANHPHHYQSKEGDRKESTLRLMIALQQEPS